MATEYGSFFKTVELHNRNMGTKDEWIIHAKNCAEMLHVIKHILSAKNYLVLPQLLIVIVVHNKFDVSLISLCFLRCEKYRR